MLYTTSECVDTIANFPLCQFDCKVWDVDTANDAMAWFLFRNIDCIRNSKQQTAQAYLPHNALLGLDSDTQIKKLLDEKGVDWNSFSGGEKWGRLIYREKEDYMKAIEIINEGIKENPEEGFLYYNRACFYAAISELDLALDDVLKSIELNDFFVDYMKKDRELDGIRTLERYKKIFN